MSNIKDVAALAGVSVTTVSRVLNKRGYISKEVYAKVYDAMERLDYQPNQLARSLFSQKTNCVGVLIPDISHPFFAEIVKMIEEKLNECGYRIFLCNAVGDGVKEQEYLSMLRQNKVDGIIIATHMLETSLYESIDLPIVALDLELGQNIPTVCADHEKGGYLAAQELIRSGCKCVLNIGGNMDVKTPSIRRYRACELMLQKAGIDCISVCLEQEFNRQTYQPEIQRLLKKYPQADGLFSTDLIAINAMKVLHMQGVRIPDAFSIVGYDGVEISSLCTPTLTHVRQPLRKIADECVQTLVRKMQGERLTDHVVLLDVELVHGGTTRQPAAMEPVKA